MNQSPLRQWKIVEVVELDPIDVSDDGSGEAFEFRIEIRCQADGTHEARVCRWETYRIPPSFPIGSTTDEEELEEWDAKILVQDESRDWSMIHGNTVSELVDNILAEIQSIFGLQG